MIENILFLTAFFVLGVYSVVSGAFLLTGSKKLLTNSKNNKILNEVNKVNNFFEKESSREFITDREYLSASARLNGYKAFGYGAFFLIGFAALLVQFIGDLKSGRFSPTVQTASHASGTPMDETYFVWTIIGLLTGVFFLCSGIFLLWASGKLPKRELPREDDMLFEAVQKFTYILMLRGHREFIEDKERLAKEAHLRGWFGILIGGEVLFATVNFAVKYFL